MRHSLLVRYVRTKYLHERGCCIFNLQILDPCMQCTSTMLRARAAADLYVACLCVRIARPRSSTSKAAEDLWLPCCIRKSFFTNVCVVAAEQLLCAFAGGVTAAGTDCRYSVAAGPISICSTGATEQATCCCDSAASWCMYSAVADIEQAANCSGPHLVTAHCGT